MSILLPDLHPLIIKEKDVQGLCSDLFQSNPLHYFSLIRCYKDGSFFPLGTHAHFMMEWFRTLPLKFPYHDHYAYKQRYTFLWNEVIPEDILHIVTTKHHIYHGMAMIYRYKHYFDMISFAMPNDRPLAGSYYLSCLQTLEDFYHDFLKRGRDLLKIFEKAKVVLPPEKQDQNAGKLFLDNMKGRFSFQRKEGYSYFTSREILCLHMLEEGKSYKYISSIFDVSPRTIETYISRAKKRTDMYNVQDMMNILRLS
jgi:DNA-binding CsgD family transcriptional regulator